ncbi:hypothetical protein [uncultured Polaribacter sp.]|uniref:hypothetical protein n=1 Tax=uncultured Polaribacter sp. TaxID=174711 RepID=UPI0026155997|nr:hypothetical protein [uncultured Polaribacter sp.]
MDRIEVILIFEIKETPTNFQEILKQEQEIVSIWKQQGILEHLFLRQSRDGAILIFKNVDEQKAKELVEGLPLYQFKKNVNYYNLVKQF